MICLAQIGSSNKKPWLERHGRFILTGMLRRSKHGEGFSTANKATLAEMSSRLPATAGITATLHAAYFSKIGML
jgi:hypothetical protein